MPLNSSNKYIWIRSASPEPYTVIEGKITTEQSYESITAYLDKNLNKYTVFEPNSSVYSILDKKESIFNMLILKKDLTFGIIWMGEINLENQNISNSTFLENLNIFTSYLEDAIEDKKNKNVKLNTIKHQVSVY
ncbi:MAG TPA: hypothetical protein EYG73_03425 [Arcobacter sp.]|nr:hypothetical protein [Arcobacter sp.]